MLIDGNVAKIEQMNVAGGKLPKKFSVKLDVEIDFANAPLETILKYAAGGQSARVAFQSTLRNLPVKKLHELESRDVVRVHVTEVTNEDFFMSTADKMEALLATMTPEQKELLKAQLETVED